MASNMSDHSAQSMDKSLGSNNVINLTTSETMRLDCDRTNLHLQSGVVGGGQVLQKKKNSSFQITSITSRLSNDGGEDSADDTEDISDTMDTSKVTDLDQETPSFSEDYSKSEEVFLGPAPVIPTSSQYGITALVQQTGSGGVMTAMLPQGVTVNVTEGGIALAKADGESVDVNHWQNRFKIVKIDSNEPFKRGRWICLDFMDSPAVTASSALKKDDMSSVVVNSNIMKEGEMGDHQPQTVVPVQLSVTHHQQQHQQPGQPHTISVPPQYQTLPNSTSTPMMPASQTGQPTMGLQPAPHMSSQPPNQPTLQYTTQPVPHPVQLQTPMSQSFTPSQTSSTQAQTPPQAQQPPLQQGQVPTGTSLPQGVNATQQVPGMVLPSSLPQHQAVPPQSTLTTQNLQQHQQQQLSMTQVGLGAPTMQPTVINTMGAPGLTQPVVGHPVTSQPAGVMGQPQPTHVPQQTVVQPSAGQQQLTQPLPSNPMTGTQPKQPQQQQPMAQVPGAGQLPLTQHMVTGQVPAPTAAPVQPTVIAPGQAVQANTASDQQTTQSQQPPSNLEGIPVAQPTDDATNATPPAAAGQDDESASNASSVAIDNKIEQAMDLVKSHLMFAVREEVEVLKEKITELMERISQLEYENMVLRQYATQEALQQLQQPHHPSNT